MEFLGSVARSILAGPVEMLLDKLKLESFELLKYALTDDNKVELEKLKTKLVTIRKVLEDAEEKQIAKEDVKIWLGDLRDLAYDVEDILDEFQTEALRRKLEVEPQASTSKKRKFITFLTGLNPSAVKFDAEMGQKIKDISMKLEEITQRKDDLKLGEIIARRSNRASERLPTTSLVNEAVVYGRKNDEEAIIDLLLSGEASDAIVSVIPIQGMGGLGKTTLAKLVYNNGRVTDSFDLKAWVCVSEDFNVIEITKTLLGSESRDAKDLNSLQEKLKEKLTGKKFLIVLDDVWNEDYLKWTELRLPLEAGAPGSRIIVTTRNQYVSSTVSTGPAYHLKHLSNDYCLSLFCQHALEAKNFDAHPNLKGIGQTIVKRCNGLPLAAKVLGGLLRGKPIRDEWEYVLNSNIWDIPEDRCGIFPALRLSYHHLPSHLKQCFAYCAIFPKDYEFDEDHLVLLWMAEGFLQQPTGKKKMKDIGHEYFRDLLSRSFFQQSSTDESRFVMHDLINDLAQSVSGERCFHYDNKVQGKSHGKVRYSSFVPNRYDTWQRFNDFYGMERLRTFLALPNSASRYVGYYLSNKVLCDLLPKLKCLRVLSLSGYQIQELPDSIGNLKHLRHLNLSCTKIECLPESVGALYNLQTLILYYCWRLTKLPSTIGNLINLHNLDISETNRLEEMPLGIGKLTSLHNLNKFIVGNSKGDGLGITELKNLSHLCGKLSILGLHNVVNIRAAKDAILKEKQGLDELTLKWIEDFNDSRNERDELQVLDSLQPYEDLKKLSIAFYGGTRFPSWVGGPSFTKLEELSLIRCRKSTSLPSLGQLSFLKVLCIRDMNAVKSVGLEFLGNCSHPNEAFKSLEKLKFEDMLEWEDWSSSNPVEEANMEEFPRLQELVIKNCPKLARKLPSHLPSLIKLEITTCPLLENSLVTLPSVREIIVKHCNEMILKSMVNLSSLIKLVIHKCPWPENSHVSLPSLREMYVEDCNEIVLKSIVDLSSLTILRIKRILGLSCLDQRLMGFLVALEVLEIEDCNELKCLWCNGAESEKLACLRSLKISVCPKLVSLAVQEQDLHSLISLKSLTVSYCASLERLPNWVMHGNSSNQSLLEKLVIKKCPSLKSFPRGKLVTTLKRLNIEYCENLESLPEGIMHEDNDGNNASHLEKLRIFNCSFLTSFPIGKFPATLQTLEMCYCEQLESLSERMLQNNTTLGYINIQGYFKSLLRLECLTHLTRLDISDCSALESFPERGLSIPNLKVFTISICTNLKSLPNQMHNLTSLQDLRIGHCPGIVSIPEGGLPPNLRELQIRSCENLKQPMLEWGLHTLTSLKCFTLGCPPDIVSFPDDECLMLPAALTFILISDRNNLKSISKGIQNLTSLRELIIEDCPKLRSLPKEGLPVSLGIFHIRNCPLLKERCLKDKGEYWSILADIPCVLLYD